MEIKSSNVGMRGYNNLVPISGVATQQVETLTTDIKYLFNISNAGDSALLVAINDGDFVSISAGQDKVFNQYINITKIEAKSDYITEYAILGAC